MKNIFSCAWLSLGFITRYVIIKREYYTVRQSPIKWMGRKTLSLVLVPHRYTFYCNINFLEETLLLEIGLSVTYRSPLFIVLGVFRSNIYRSPLFVVLGVFRSNIYRSPLFIVQGVFRSNYFRSPLFVVKNVFWSNVYRSPSCFVQAVFRSDYVMSPRSSCRVCSGQITLGVLCSSCSVC